MGSAVAFCRVVDVSSRAPSAASPYDVNGIQSKLVVPGFMGSRLQPPHAEQLLHHAGVACRHFHAARWRPVDPANQSRAGPLSTAMFRAHRHLLARRDIEVLAVLQPLRHPGTPGAPMADTGTSWRHRFTRRTAALSRPSDRRGDLERGGHEPDDDGVHFAAAEQGPTSVSARWRSAGSGAHGPIGLLVIDVFDAARHVAQRLGGLLRRLQFP